MSLRFVEGIRFHMINVRVEGLFDLPASHHGAISDLLYNHRPGYAYSYVLVHGYRYLFCSSESRLNENASF